MSEKYICRSCGYFYDDGTLPYGADLLSPTYEICPCCGVEHGYEDCTKKSSARYRINWIKSGANWNINDLKPANWDLRRQLKNINLIDWDKL